MLHTLHLSLSLKRVVWKQYMGDGAVHTGSSEELRLAEWSVERLEAENLDLQNLYTSILQCYKDAPLSFEHPLAPSTWISFPEYRFDTKTHCLVGLRKNFHR
ncbi:MAG: hypothetical protein ACPG5T_07340 [Endozoicomonas sp.]